MKIEQIAEEYPILNRAVQILQKQGINELFPPQEEAIQSGVLDGKNLLLSCNTGAGKTMIAELAAVKNWAERGEKTIYVVPFRALAMEKFEDFKKYETLGLKTGLAIGGYDSPESWLRTSHVIVCTFEKLNSLIRHQAPWLSEVGLAVLDEVHEIGSSRGPTLEIVSLWLKNYKVQFLGLSATIGNTDEISGWLNAELVESNFRPVPLHEGTYWNGIIDFQTKNNQSLGGGELKLVKDELKKDKQSLMFVNTRREAEALARRAQETCQNHADKDKLGEVSEKILNALSKPTEQCKKLAQYVSNGCAFHHAGILHPQRKLVEEAYRQGLIKFIAATITLVAGVNLPSHRIIIRNVKRYNGDWRVSTYKQAVGRAGRIGFDSEGEAVVLCKNEHEKDFVLDSYINGEPEPAMSGLNSKSELRMHTLGAIATQNFTREKLTHFFSQSFYAYQNKNQEFLNKRLEEITDQLIKWGFVQEKKYLKPTKLGKRISELYVDPATGHLFVEELKRVSGEKDHTFGFLHLISQAVENQPPPSIRKSEAESIQEKADEHISELLHPSPLPWDPEFEDFFRANKLAIILNDWINEKKEDYILSTYHIAPGNLRGRVYRAKWLSYAAHEIAKIIGKKKAQAELYALGKRIKHGCRKELLPLVRLKMIGRVRGRRLWNNGIKNKADIKNNRKKASKLVGEKVISKALS